MDGNEQLAEIEERVRKLERSLQRKHRLGKLWRRGRPVLYGLVAVVVAGAGVLVVRHLRGPAADDQPAAAAPVAPFANTPAANYPKGAAGITLPAAKAVSGFSAKQVAADLARVRTALIAARLDERMLDRHDTSAFVKLLAPSSQATAKKQFGTDNGLSLVTWIDPRTPLAPGEQPRVSGTVVYRSQPQQGIPTLTVTTNFIWVYAFRRADFPLAAEHDEIVWSFSESSQLRAEDRGMFISSIDGYSAQVDCTAVKTGLLAPTPLSAESAPDPRDTEDPAQLLNADHSLTIRDNC